VGEDREHADDVVLSYSTWRSVTASAAGSGGLVTDECARVLRESGDPIPGLYATGNATASVMGHSYAGPGADRSGHDVRLHRGEMR
jgi:3-oxosteroid 1-dehydrogenase